jgi:hypothetical protein
VEQGNLHFDAKAAVTDYIQETHPSLAAKTSYLQVGMYLQNWKGNQALRPQKLADGTFTINIPKAFANNLAPLVDPSQDTGLFVQALVGSPAGSTMLGYSQQLSYGDLWRMWARVHGVKLEIKDEELDFGDMPEWLQWEFRESFAYVVKCGFAGGNPEVKSPEDLGVDMSLATDVEEWVRKEDYSSIL